MNVLEMIFWLALACVVYTYAGYPALMFVRARCRPRTPLRRPFAGTFSIIISARNEEAAIARRLEEMCWHVKNSGLAGEIVLVSDGSSDATAARGRDFAVTGLVRVLELTDNVGKSAALTVACQSCPGNTGHVIVFADARQTWADDALVKLLENFADPHVGAVSGDLVLQTGDGMLAGVGLYWRFEKWLRKNESLAYSQVGVTGAICAVRRVLFRPIPQGTILDDIYWPLQVAMQGYRVVHDERAIAYDRLPDRPRDEFRRKVRTLSGNFQLAWRLPASLLPWRNPVWLAWLSRKLLRLAVPWALLALLVSSACLCFVGAATKPAPYVARLAVYWLALVGQVGGYGLALVSLAPLARRNRLASAAASFVVLNTAAWLAFWIWLRGRADKTWKQIAYVAIMEKAVVATEKEPALRG